MCCSLRSLNLVSVSIHNYERDKKIFHEGREMKELTSLRLSLRPVHSTLRVGHQVRKLQLPSALSNMLWVLRSTKLCKPSIYNSNDGWWSFRGANKFSLGCILPRCFASIKCLAAARFGGCHLTRYKSHSGISSNLIWIISCNVINLMKGKVTVGYKKDQHRVLCHAAR